MVGDHVEQPLTVSGGAFHEGARNRAIERCLPLLATYFASAESWDLVAQPALSDAEGRLDVELARALRLRVLLALAEELIGILQPIMARPTFRYAHAADESAGLIAGRLDVPRYTARRGVRTAPKVYPVRVVERDFATPENVLAVCALDAVNGALAGAPLSVLPESGPERRELARVRADVQRHRQLPPATSLAKVAARAMRDRSLDQQRRLAQRRIERGDVRRAEPYRRLTRWVEAFLTGVGVDPDKRLWAFYDTRFDSRLFEIWTLSVIADGLSERFGAPAGGRLLPLWTRRDGPIGSWTTPYGRLEIFFQREARSIGLPGRWKIQSTDRRIRAIPDIAIRLTRPDETNRWLLVECKLRRQASASPGLPTEELYKLFAYFDHLMAGTPPRGALVHYTPGANDRVELVATAPDSREGAAGAIGVDPADPDAAAHALSWITATVDGLLRPGSEK